MITENLLELTIAGTILSIIVWLPILKERDKTFNAGAFGAFGIVYSNILDLVKGGSK